MDISMGCVLERNAEIIFTDLDNVVVMMDAEKGVYYELDPVGARIWSLLESARPLGEVCDALVGEYDVEPDECGRDVVEFLEKARELEIIRVSAPAAP